MSLPYTDAASSNSSERALLIDNPPPSVPTFPEHPGSNASIDLTGGEKMSGCAWLNSFSAPLIVGFFKGQGGAFSLMKDGFWKTYGTSFCFVTRVVNSHLYTFPWIPGLGGRQGLGWPADAAFLRMEPSPDNTHGGGHVSRSLSLLDIRLLFSGWGEATLHTRETLEGRPSWRASGAGGGGVLSFIRSMKTIRGLSPGSGGAWGGKPRWARAEGKQAQV